MIIFKEKKECCGCGACYNICPQKAITMETDEKGFLYPKIDQKKCINCGLCQKTCPFKQKKNPSIPNQQVYAVKNSNEQIRNRSSSGGIFYELASYIIEHNGIVFGTIFDRNWKAVVSPIEKKEDILSAQGSKYVQSNTKEIYRNIKELLKKNKLVLFTGTPCQVSGLNCYLSKKYDNLITCDVVCHGVPSPKIWQDYKETLEKKYHSKLNHFTFRYKNKEGTQNIKAEFQNGKEYVQSCAIDPYYILFRRDYMLRESCFACPFSNMNRVSDLTLGDYWGLEKYHSEFEDKKGISLLLINTKKGEKIITAIEPKLNMQKSKKSYCLQPSLQHPTEKPEKQKEFWFTYCENGYCNTIKKFAKLSIIIKGKYVLKKILKK